jgi:PIN domain nuclease of toxin-antitoxin system
VAAVLLDTCAAVWIGNRESIAPSALQVIRAAAKTAGILVSAVTGWEIGIATTRPRNPLVVLPTAQIWLADLLARPGFRRMPLEPEVAVNAAYLPGTFHRDPADRLLIATAREFGAPLVTRDRRILDYAAQGYVDAIPC